jgi:hypothetical protein
MKYHLFAIALSATTMLANKMKTTFGFTIPSLVVGFVLSSCGLISNNLETSSPRRVNNEYAATFEKGDFVPDKRPLKSKDSRDLRELALTLPIWESESDEATKWVYVNSSAATDSDQWTTPADGAQSAVRLKRLPSSPTGAQRIEIWIPPSMLNSSPSSVSWTSVVERKDGGWLVLSARKHKV